MYITITKDIGNITKVGDVHEVCEDRLGRGPYISARRPRRDISQENIYYIDLYLHEIEGFYDRVIWKPRVGEKYYAICFGFADGVNSFIYRNDVYDDNRYKHKTVFKTEDEALEALDKILEVLG